MGDAQPSGAPAVSLRGPASVAVRSPGPEDASSRVGFAAYYQRHMPRLVLFALRHCGNMNEATEVAQGAFALAFEQWSSIEHPAAWLRVVATRIWCRGQQRREQPAEHIPDSSGGHCPVAAFELAEEEERVYEALSWLPLKQRQAMAWHIDQFSAVEIAQHLGMDPAAVRQNLARARAGLRKALESRGEETQ